MSVGPLTKGFGYFLIAAYGVGPVTSFAQEQAQKPVHLLCAFVNESDKFPVVIDLGRKSVVVGETRYTIYKTEKRFVFARAAKHGEPNPFHLQIDRMTGEFVGARFTSTGEQVGPEHVAACSRSRGPMF